MARRLKQTASSIVRRHVLAHLDGRNDKSNYSMAVSERCEAEMLSTELPLNFNCDPDPSIRKVNRWTEMRRLLVGEQRIPADIVRAMVMELPEACRNDCVDELISTQYERRAYVPMGDGVEGAAVSIGDVLTESADVVCKLGEVMGDNEFDHKDRHHIPELRKEIYELQDKLHALLARCDEIELGAPVRLAHEHR